MTPLAIFATRKIDLQLVSGWYVICVNLAMFKDCRLIQSLLWRWKDFQKYSTFSDLESTFFLSFFLSTAHYTSVKHCIWLWTCWIKNMLLLAINNLAILQKPSFVQRLREAILYHYGATVGHFKLFFRFLKKKSYLDSETRISVRLQYGRTS